MTYRINGQIVSKEEWDEHTAKLHSKPGWKPIQAGDRIQLKGAQAFDAFVSPVDNSYIDSEYKLREHNAKNNVRQVGNDLVGKGNHGKTREQSINKQKGTTND